MTKTEDSENKDKLCQARILIEEVLDDMGVNPPHFPIAFELVEWGEELQIRVLPNMVKTAEMELEDVYTILDEFIRDTDIRLLGG